jgi:hypothetical protein
MAKHHFILIMLLCIIYAGSCPSTGKAETETIYLGSTPGDDLIKMLLTISPQTKVDFIRWNLTLNMMKPGPHTFILDILYGESQPNTLGFKGGGKKVTFKGEFTVSHHNSSNIRGEIYHLKSRQWPAEITLIKLNDNLFHLLTPDNRLMTGNGGWSYTLNRQQLTTIDSDVLPALITSSILLHDTTAQVIYEGRTPCQELASALGWNVSPSCFKLKWRIILNRDPVNHEPTTYSIRKVVENVLEDDLSGNWKVINGIPGNPETIIYQLDPDNPGKSISLLAGDENIIFFLTSDYKLRVGNADFSFTLNRKEPL